MPLTVVWYVETSQGDYCFSERVDNDEYILVPQRRREAPYMSCEQVERFKTENKLVNWRVEPTDGPYPQDACRLMGPYREQKLIRAMLRPFLVSEVAKGKGNPIARVDTLAPQPLNLNTTTP